MTGDAGGGPRAERAAGVGVTELAVELLQVLLHDAKNALSTVGANVAFVREALDGADPEVSESLSDVAQATKRIRQALDDISLVALLQSAPRPAASDASGRGAQARESVPLHEAFEAALRPLQAVIGDKQVAVTYEAKSDAGFSTDPLLLRRALEIVLERALSSAGAGARVVVRAEFEGPRPALVVESSAPLARPRSRGASRDGAAPADVRFDLVRRVFESKGGSAELGERGARFTFPAG